MPLVGGKDTRLPGMSVEKAEVVLASMPRSRMPRGGGRYQVGKPYQVKGKWYRPKEDPNYKAVGLASWYGSAFHGRLTANGEVYDMTHLTAAHPTMPLPSYARVTNLKNGSSVMVRVNDRGPFAHSRVIDLSKRAAELLDYQHTGLAKVKVEYVGRAPLDGRTTPIFWRPTGRRQGAGSRRRHRIRSQGRHGRPDADGEDGKCGPIVRDAATHRRGEDRCGPVRPRKRSRPAGIRSGRA